MSRSDETTLVLHGLDMDNRVVRAGVFVRKLYTLLGALREADRLANGKDSFDYLLPKLNTGSAAVTVRERQRRRGAVHSSVEALEAATVAIYNGDRSVERLPLPLVSRVHKLSTGAQKIFSHAELTFSETNVIRIDDFLLRQSEKAYEIAEMPELSRETPLYRGLAVGSFDGVLKEIDARGTMLRGKLVTSAGGLEIDCVMNKDRIPEARESFDKRVVVDGTVHYDGSDPFPVRMDVTRIRIIGEQPDLLRWRGAFGGLKTDEIEEDW